MINQYKIYEYCLSNVHTGIKDSLFSWKVGCRIRSGKHLLDDIADRRR